MKLYSFLFLVVASLSAPSAMADLLNGGGSDGNGGSGGGLQTQGQSGRSNLDSMVYTKGVLHIMFRANTSSVQTDAAIKDPALQKICERFAALAAATGGIFAVADLVGSSASDGTVNPGTCMFIAPKD